MPLILLEEPPMSSPALSITPRPSSGPVRVEYAEAVLECDWPSRLGQHVLLGAVCQEVGGGDPDNAHADWHNHPPGADEWRRIPRTLYRVDPLPRVWAWGPGAHERIRVLGRDVRCLQLDEGRVLPVHAVRLRFDAAEVGARKRRWYRYELATPLWPRKGDLVDRPKGEPEQFAWAGRALEVAIREWLEEVGAPTEHLHVHIHRAWDARCEWHRRERGQSESATGFRARFVTSAVLPDGLGLGQHRAEGWGEVRRA